MLHVSVIVPSAGGVCVSEESGSPSASARLSGWLDALGPGRPRAQTQTELAHLGELRSKFDCGLGKRAKPLDLRSYCGIRAGPTHVFSHQEPIFTFSVFPLGSIGGWLGGNFFSFFKDNSGVYRTQRGTFEKQQNLSLLSPPPQKKFENVLFFPPRFL